MKVMIICGVFAKENEQEVIAHAKRSVEFSANVYQTKLIQGFRRKLYVSRSYECKARTAG